MEREKKILIGVLVFIVVVILVIGLRDTNNKVEKIVEAEKQVQQEADKKAEEKLEKVVEEEKQPLKEEKTEEVASDYSENNDTFMKDAYMDGCYNGSNFVYCECTFDKLVSKYGVDFVINMGREYETTGASSLTEDIMTEIAMECLIETN